MSGTIQAYDPQNGGDRFRINKILELESMTRIALFGGAFDPPQIGHVLTVAALLNNAPVDQIWLVPAGDVRSDKTQRAPAALRVEMLNLLLAELFGADTRLRIETVQADGRLPGSYTIDLLNYLQSKFPADEFHFVIGADNLPLIPAWKDGAEHMRSTKFIVMPRLGVELIGERPAHLTILPADKIVQSDASSSRVRELISANGNLVGVVPRAVQEFIQKHALYRSTPARE